MPVVFSPLASPTESPVEVSPAATRLARPAEPLVPEEFAAIVRTERLRSDRSGVPIGLLAFDARSCGGTLPGKLLRLQRTTDHVGWLPDGRLGVLLWNVSPAGVREYVARLSGEYSPRLPGHSVYVHPHVPGATAPERTDASDDVLPLEELFVERTPVWKRTLDVAGSLFGLVALSPLLVATAVAVKLTSPGPIFFAQWRSGLGGRRFQMWKFRSMVADAEARKRELMHLNEQDGPAFKIEHDPRITRIGHVIRKLSIDELPQLWNVLVGDMSLVGPRPLPCSETDGCEPWQRRRLDVTPGLTCIWQTQDRRNKIAFADWVRMDLQYSRRRTVGGDLRLILRTVWNIVCRDGRGGS